MTEETTIDTTQLLDPQRVHAVRLLPDQIAKKWGVIAAAIRRSLPPTFAGDIDSCLHRVQRDCIAGAKQVWKMYDEGGRTRALAVTELQRDPDSGLHHLLVWSMAAVEGLDAECLRLGFDTIGTFALSMGCSGVVFYTRDERLVDVARRLYPRTRMEYFVRIPAGKGE